MTNALSQSELKELLDYCPETGLFFWINNTSNIKSGDVAGSKTNDGYTRIRINKKSYQAHRLVWLYVTGKFPDNDIDHINHNRKDNRILNLRDCTRKENHMNRAISEKNTSGTTGVNWDKANKKWMAGITVSGKLINLGRFKNINDAIIVRKMADYKYNFHINHGE